VSGHHNFDELRARTPERRARVASYERATRAVMRLRQLRTTRGVTQDQLAHAMGVSQAHISRIEHKGDLYLSTVSTYVAALGGELHLCAVFPDKEEVDLAVLPSDERAPAIATFHQ